MLAAEGPTFVLLDVQATPLGAPTSPGNAGERATAFKRALAG